MSVNANMGRVLITGINGFTGRYIAEHLVLEGYDVYGTVSSQNSLENCSISGVTKVYQCSLSSKESLEQVLVDVQPESLIHLAAISFVAHDDASAIYSVNVLGTENLLCEIEKHTPNIKRVIIASSANVYGDNESQNITEQDEYSPVNHYAISKVSMEYVANTFSKRLPIVITRPFNYTGVGQDAKFLIPKIIKHFKKKLPLIELGNLDILRDVSDVRYVSRVYAGLLTSPSIDGEVFNICSGTVVSLEAMVDLCKQLSGHDIDIAVNPLFVRDNEIKRLCGSTKKLDTVLGDLRVETIEDTFDWMFKHVS